MKRIMRTLKRDDYGWTNPHHNSLRSHANQQQDHGAKICVGARRRDRRHRPQNVGNEKIPDLEFDCTFGTD